jgi:hypothetical protein
VLVIASTSHCVEERRDEGAESVMAGEKTEGRAAGQGIYTCPYYSDWAEPRRLHSVDREGSR